MNCARAMDDFPEKSGGGRKQASNKSLRDIHQEVVARLNGSFISHVACVVTLIGIATFLFLAS